MFQCTNEHKIIIPTTVMDVEKPKTAEKVPWFNYNTDKEEVQRRIANFIQETQANLQRPRKETTIGTYFVL